VKASPAVLTEDFLVAGNAMGLEQPALVAKLIEACGAARSYAALTSSDFPRRDRLLFAFFHVLAPGEMTPERLESLYQLYATAPSSELPLGGDYLIKYEAVGPKPIAHVTSILVRRSDQEPAVRFALTGFFNKHSQVGGSLSHHFAGELELLKRAYLNVGSLNSVAVFL
jgi:hypothetical protein